MPAPSWTATLERIAARRGYTSLFADFVRLVSCSYSQQTREEEYLAVAKCYDRTELDLFAKAAAELVLAMQDPPRPGRGL